MSKSKERGLVSRFFGMIFKKNYATKEVTKEKPVKKVANDAFTAEILNGEPKAEVKKVKSLPVKKYEELDLSEINMTPKRVCGTKAMIQFLHEEFEYSEGHEILYGEFEDEYKVFCIDHELLALNRNDISKMVATICPAIEKIKVNGVTKYKNIKRK